MVATAVPVSKPMAPCPGSKRLVETRALLPMIYVARVSCKEMPSSIFIPPASPLPPVQEGEPVALGAGGASP